MEQEEKTTHTGSKESRGVSSNSSYGTGQDSSGLPHPELSPFPAAAEESRHARPSSSLYHPPPLGGVSDEFSGSTEQETDSMDDGAVASHWGYGGFMATSRSTVPFFSHPYGVADDLGVTYYPDGGLNALSVMSRGPSTPQNLRSDSTRQPQSRRGRQASFDNRMPVARHGQSTPTELEAVITIDSSGTGYYPEQAHDYNIAGRNPNTEDSGEEAHSGSGHYSLPTSSPRRRSDTRNIPIPERVNGFRSTGSLDGYLGPSPMATSSFSPSSYPPAPPLLPPPPITDYPFDPSAVMFSGPGAVDGGVRVVYEDYDHEHDHEHDHTYEENRSDEAAAVADSSGHAGGSSWTRHTRVYGGGVCLACAAAGGGGFYGARVRPEDKR